MVKLLKTNNYQMIEKIFEVIDCMEFKDKNNRTWLEIAISQNNFEMIKLVPYKTDYS